MTLEKRKRFNIKIFEKKLNNKYTYYNLFLFIIGIILISISVDLFFFPNNIITGGITGIAIIINNYFKIDLSLLLLFISSIILVLSFLIFGLDYGSKHVLGTILFPLFIKCFSLINKVIVLENISLFLLIAFGALISGIGFGLIKKSGYSLGGFYIIYDFLHEKLKISIGMANIMCNILMIGLGIISFGLNKCIYAAIGLYITSYFTDRTMLGVSRNKAFYIITKKATDVKEYIINNLNYTVTIVNAKGGYSDKKNKMLLCVIPTTEYIKVKEVIKAIDKNAFFLITDSYSVSRKRKLM